MEEIKWVVLIDIMRCFAEHGIVLDNKFDIFIVQWPQV